MYRAALVFVTALACVRPVDAHSQTWDYRSYPDGENILQSPEKPAAPGYITLRESGGVPVFTMSAGRVTKCFSGVIPAKVESTAETLIITVRRDLPGCFTARFVINTDGSGGRRETIRKGEWVWDGLEHGLTRR